jgi:hypothetical protein
MKFNRNWIFGIIFSVAVIILFGSIMYHGIKLGDFPLHIGWAKEFSENGYIRSFPHSLFARAVSVTRALLPANYLVWMSPWAKQVWDIKSFDLSALIVVIICYLAAAWIILSRLVKTVLQNDWGRRQVWILGLATVCLLLVGPISFFTMWDRMYLGYITGNPYHNPTYLLLRPFALSLFFIAADNFFAKWRWKQSIVAGGLLILATLSKPSFTLTFLPTIAILLLVYLKRWKKINWPLLVISIGLCGVIILGYQYWLTYIGQNSDRIAFAPFKAILIHVPNIPTALLFALMSVLFPLSVVLLYWKEIWKQISIQIAWINFFIGIGMAFLLTEVNKASHLNFWWGPMTGIFILFYCSFEFWSNKIINENQTKTRIQSKDLIILVIFVLHLICGILYFIKVFINTEPSVVH